MQKALAHPIVIKKAQEAYNTASTKVEGSTLTFIDGIVPEDNAIETSK